MTARLRAACAGAAAATLWGLQEPLDDRVFRTGYSDVALLGKFATRGRHWRAAGFTIHALNGAVFGLAFHEGRRRLRTNPRALALAMALAEHATLYPLFALVERRHPARGEPGVPRELLENPRVLAQETWRHVLFGAALGRLA